MDLNNVKFSTRLTLGFVCLVAMVGSFAMEGPPIVCPRQAAVHP